MTRRLVSFSSDTVADDWHHRISPKKIITLAMKRLEGLAERAFSCFTTSSPATVIRLPGLLARDLKQRGFHIVEVVPASVDQF